MRRDMDKIQFENRAEVEELLKAVGKYVATYPQEKDNQTLKEFYDLLDVMDMAW